MQVHHLLYLVVIGLITSCKTKSTPKLILESPTNPTSLQSCFAYISLKDSVVLHLNFKGDTFTGNLEYYYFEKDQNKGTLIGKMNGDTLFAEYKFMSEGMESYREVAFLKSGSNLVEGYGEVEEKNNKMFFKNKDSLSFTSKNILNPKACK